MQEVIFLQILSTLWTKVVPFGLQVANPRFCHHPIQPGAMPLPVVYLLTEDRNDALLLFQHLHREHPDILMCLHLSFATLLDIYAAHCHQVRSDA